MKDLYSISGLNSFTFIDMAQMISDEKQIISVSNYSSISVWNFYGAD
jgi:hypothetical protein